MNIITTLARKVRSGSPNLPPPRRAGRLLLSGSALAGTSAGTTMLLSELGTRMEPLAP